MQSVRPIEDVETEGAASNMSSSGVGNASNSGVGNPGSPAASNAGVSGEQNNQDEDSREE